MKHHLDKVVEFETGATGMPADLVTKLAERIDELKLMGYTGGEASSKFGDYLSFLGLPDDGPASEFFARRWTDHRVITPVSPKMRSYVNSDTPVFTVSRLEPQYQDKPFTGQGLKMVAPGSYGPRGAKGPVREARKLGEIYLNFIIVENLPPIFYMEVDNSRMSEILSTGLPKAGATTPYKMYMTPDDARDSLFKDLRAHGRSNSTKDMNPGNFTLLEIDSFGLSLDSNIFYPRTLHGHRQGTRAYGYYYEGAFDREFLSVSKQNISVEQ